MAFSAHQFARDDLPRLNAFISANAVARAPVPVYLMTSDVAWRMPGSGPKQNLRLWEDAAGLAGFVWFEPTTGVEFDLRHDLPFDHPIAADMLAWSETRRRASGVYDAELDIVLETGDGTFAAYCICWADSIAGVGSYEPVGTRPEWRGKGVGREVIYEGFRRLKAKGMRVARVATAGFNTPAQALYESCGFVRVGTCRTYLKRLA
jgi:GNAT superfamily N-acetyltransferase